MLRTDPDTDAAFRKPLTRGAAFGRTKNLVFPVSHRAVLRQTLQLRLCWLSCLAAGLAILLAVCPDLYRSGDRAFCITVAISSAVLTLLGALGLLGWLGRRLEADKLRKQIILRRGTWPLTRSTTFAWRDIRAIQLCQRVFPPMTESAGWTALEANLVLRTPPNRRINLFSHGDQPNARADAAALANFLGVPLLDCT